MVTASDSVNLRLAPVPGTAEATHARYRGRPGAGIAVDVLQAKARYVVPLPNAIRGSVIIATCPAR